MTITEAISEINNLWPSQYTRQTLTKWLCRLDEAIYEEILSTHEGCPERQEGVLLVPSPYDYDIYINYLHSQIDRQNGEIDRYNVSAALYNEAHQRFADYWNRTHRPIQAPKFQFQPAHRGCRKCRNSPF